MAQRILPRVVLVTTMFSAGVAGAAPKAIKTVPTIAAASDDATKQHARVRKLLPSATREKAEGAGKAFAAKTLETMTETAVLDAAKKDSAKLISSTSTDITALVFIVMMEAAKSAEEDLKAIMEGVKKINSEREKIRAKMKELEGKSIKPKKAPAPAYLKKITTAKTANLQATYHVLPDVSAVICESKEEALCLDELQQKEDSLGDLSEEMALRMQMYMDRRAKVLQVLSNIMKKTADTADAIIANMK